MPNAPVYRTADQSSSNTTTILSPPVGTTVAGDLLIVVVQNGETTTKITVADDASTLVSNLAPDLYTNDGTRSFYIFSLKLTRTPLSLSITVSPHATGSTRRIACYLVGPGAGNTWPATSEARIGRSGTGSTGVSGSTWKIPWTSGSAQSVPQLMLFGLNGASMSSGLTWDPTDDGSYDTSSTQAQNANCVSGYQVFSTTPGSPNDAVGVSTGAAQNKADGAIVYITQGPWTASGRANTVTAAKAHALVKRWARGKAVTVTAARGTPLGAGGSKVASGRLRTVTATVGKLDRTRRASGRLRTVTYTEGLELVRHSAHGPMRNVSVTRAKPTWRLRYAAAGALRTVSTFVARPKVSVHRMSGRLRAVTTAIGAGRWRAPLSMVNRSATWDGATTSATWDGATASATWDEETTA